MALNLQEYQVTLELLEPMLGTTPLDREVFKKHVVRPEVDPELVDEECVTIEDVPGWTGFHKDERGRPHIFNYVVKGQLKSACQALWEIRDTESQKLRAYRKKIDRHVFIVPRRIFLRLPDGEDIIRAKDHQDDDDSLTVPVKRPLRAMTAKGERITIARSEVAPVGTELCFGIMVIKGSPITEPMLEEWLSYGRLLGLGQWRSASWGSFCYSIKKVEHGR